MNLLEDFDEMRGWSPLQTDHLFKRIVAIGIGCDFQTMTLEDIDMFLKDVHMFVSDINLNKICKFVLVSFKS